MGHNNSFGRTTYKLILAMGTLTLSVRLLEEAEEDFEVLVVVLSASWDFFPLAAARRLAITTS